VADDGAAFLNLRASADPWQPMDVANEFRRHLVLQNTITWVKSVTVEGGTRGHVRPVNSRRYLNRSHECIYHLTKGSDVPINRLAIGVPYPDKTNLRRWKAAAQGSALWRQHLVRSLRDGREVRRRDAPSGRLSARTAAPLPPDAWRPRRRA
jgi:hypothetical protein